MCERPTTYRMFAQHESKGGGSESGAHFKTASHTATTTATPSFLVDGPDGFENFEQGSNSIDIS